MLSVFCFVTFLLCLFCRTFICLFVCSLGARLPHQGKLCPPHVRVLFALLLLPPLSLPLLLLLLLFLFSLRTPPAKWDLLLFLYFKYCFNEKRRFSFFHRPSYATSSMGRATTVIGFVAPCSPFLLLCWPFNWHGLLATKVTTIGAN